MHRREHVLHKLSTGNPEQDLQNRAARHCPEAGKNEKEVLLLRKKQDNYLLYNDLQRISLKDQKVNKS